ncbi:MAG TPA: hypothetical protein VI893_06275 [Thermoplasmata archaeon]|nr:hypothetical protein [Thermoplasmata archaeon]
MSDIVLMMARAARDPPAGEIRGYCLREYGVENCIWTDPGSAEEELTPRLDSRDRRGGPIGRLLDLLGRFGGRPAAV